MQFDHFATHQPYSDNYADSFVSRQHQQQPYHDHYPPSSANNSAVNLTTGAP
jgi:hypothetical protein